MVLVMAVSIFLRHKIFAWLTAVAWLLATMNMRFDVMFQQSFPMVAMIMMTFTQSYMIPQYRPMPPV